MNTQIQSFSDLVALCMQQHMDPNVLQSFQDFLRRNNVNEWMIVSDYHLEKSDSYENYVSVFTVLPGGKHFLSRTDVDAGLPTKLSQSSVTDSDIEFLRKLNHFTFIFVSDKKFRPAAPTADAARASMDLSIEDMLKWKNAADCKQIISQFRRLRQEANAVGFNLKLHNHATLSASCVAAIALIMLQTIPIETINWLSDRDAMIDNLDGIVYTMFHLNMVAFAQIHKLKPFNLI